MEKRIVSEILTHRNGEEPGDERPRLVLDTNTVLALWTFRDPVLDDLRAWIEAGNCCLYSREDALEELRRVLAYRQFGLSDALQRTSHETFRSILTNRSTSSDGISTGELATLPHCRDMDDQKFLEIAFQTRATYLLTRDKALLRLARHRSIRNRFATLTPEHFQAKVLAAPTLLG